MFKIFASLNNIPVFKFEGTGYCDCRNFFRYNSGDGVHYGDCYGCGSGDGLNNGYSFSSFSFSYGCGQPHNGDDRGDGEGTGDCFGDEEGNGSLDEMMLFLEESNA